MGNRGLAGLRVAFIVVPLLGSHAPPSVADHLSFSTSFERFEQTGNVLPGVDEFDNGAVSPWATLGTANESDGLVTLLDPGIHDSTSIVPVLLDRSEIHSTDVNFGFSDGAGDFKGIATLPASSVPDPGERIGLAANYLRTGSGGEQLRDMILVSLDHIDPVTAAALGVASGLWIIQSKLVFDLSTDPFGSLIDVQNGAGSPFHLPPFPVTIESVRLEIWFDDDFDRFQTGVLLEGVGFQSISSPIPSSLPVYDAQDAPSHTFWTLQAGRIEYVSEPGALPLLVLTVAVLRICVRPRPPQGPAA
jgi:hypothetical protein